MLHVIFGLFFLALGIWGLYDAYYYVVDLIRGVFPLCLLMLGSIAILAGVMPHGIREDSDHDEG